VKSSYLPLAKTKKQEKFWKSFQPINRVTATDTYKRTMGCSNETFADSFSSYTLSARRSLNEEGANGRLINAGLEKVLYPWFTDPIGEEEIEEAKDFFENEANVKKFVRSAWEKVKENGGRLPVDIHGLPGGQTLLVKGGKYVPLMSVEGVGALVSHLEPSLEQIYAPIIQATKAKLMEEVAGEQFAEVGVRGDRNFNEHTSAMLSIFVGGGLNLTSNDQAVFLFREYFGDIGTMGHEFVQSYQRQSLSLEEAQEKAFDDFVSANERSALLVDTIDTVRSGFPAAIRTIKKYEGTGKLIMPRLDSGDVTEQCLIWKRMTLEAGIEQTKIIVEDGYTPQKAFETKRKYSEEGYDPEDIIVGAGGYFNSGCTRDALSLVFKRGATEHDGKLETSIKFSDDVGKVSIPGRVRVYEKGSTLIVAQEGEEIDGNSLFVPLVKNGRIVYNESLETQRERAERTWRIYDEIEYSGETQRLIDERRKELVFAKEVLVGGAR